MTALKKYRTKPVTIEAIGPLTGNNIGEAARWCNAKIKDTWHPGPGRGMVRGLTITTLEGDMYASYGDYIIRGVQGNLYSCKPDIFEQTYELEGTE